MPDSFDCIVVGGGIAGAAAARALALAGCRALLVERGDVAGAATPAAAGMLAPQIEAHAGDPLLPLALAAREAYPELVRALGQAGRTVGFARRGILRVALDDVSARTLERQVAAQLDMGLDAEWWTADHLRRRIPGIAQAARGALFAPNDGSVNNVALGRALLEDAVARGVETELGSRAEELLAGHGRVSGVRTSRAERHAAAVVLAAGAWTPLLGGLPRPVPVEPVRGQMALVAWPTGAIPTVLFGPEGYVVPREDGAVLGSTMEKAGFDASTTEAGLAQVRRATSAILPALARQPFRRTWAGLRPVSPDALPILGADPDVAGLFYATGFGRNGILLGPLAGEIVRDLVVRGETKWDLTPYSIARFAL